MKTYSPGIQKSSMCGVWAAPGAPETIPKGGGLRPPPFGMVSEATGAAQTSKIDVCRPTQKPYIKNPSVRTGASGPEVVGLGGLNGPLPPQKPLGKVGGEAPHLEQWVLR
jgi:hypothetical protein